MNPSLPDHVDFHNHISKRVASFTVPHTSDFPPATADEVIQATDLHRDLCVEMVAKINILKSHINEEAGVQTHDVKIDILYDTTKPFNGRNLVLILTY